MGHRESAIAALAVVLLACRGNNASPTPEAGLPAPQGIAPAASRPQVGPRPPRPVQPPSDEATLARIASAVVRREAPSSFVLDAWTRQAACDDIALREIRLVPESLDGGWGTSGPWAGVRVLGVRSDRLAGKLGLVNGDLVTAVDEIALDSQASFDSAVDRLCGAPSVTVHVAARRWQDAGPIDLGWRVGGDAG